VPDYYAILGVQRDAAPDDIKRAYRKLARESHPDANPDDPHAEDRFKQISEAYNVLSDPAARQRYDTFGDAGAAGGFGAGGFGDLGDILETFFGGSPFGRQRTRPRTSAVAGQDIGVTAVLTLDDVLTGVAHEVQLDTVGVCERCAGDGCEPGTFRGRCGRCGGQGEIRASRQTILGTVVTSRPCATCEGTGEAPTVPCTQCRGTGRTRTARTDKVDIPPGVADGMTLRVRGRGEAGVRGGPDGDLYVQIRVEPHEIFERDGDDLACELSVPLTQAVLGADVTVATLVGEERLPIPPGTQHGAVLRLKAHGMPRLDGRGRGDLRVHVSVEIPKKISADERRIFEELAEVRGEEVGGEVPGIFRRIRDTLRGS